MSRVDVHGQTIERNKMKKWGRGMVVGGGESWGGGKGGGSLVPTMGDS